VDSQKNSCQLSLNSVALIPLDDTALAAPIPVTDLPNVRDMAFGYVDARCTGYLDAIFWARCSEKTTLSLTSATAAATGSMVAATGAAASTIGIVAAAFGLGSSFFETSYTTFSDSIEPCNLVSLVEKARNAYLTDLPNPKFEAQALQ
jgi:hypothetical protein